MADFLRFCFKGVEYFCVLMLAAEIVWLKLFA